MKLKSLKICGYRLTDFLLIVDFIVDLFQLVIGLYIMIQLESEKANCSRRCDGFVYSSTDPKCSGVSNNINSSIPVFWSMWLLSELHSLHILFYYAHKYNVSALYILFSKKDGRLRYKWECASLLAEYVISGFCSLFFGLMSELGASATKCRECSPAATCDFKLEAVSVIFIVIGSFKIFFGLLLMLKRTCCSKYKFNRWILWSTFFMFWFSFIWFPRSVWRYIKGNPEPKELPPPAYEDEK